MYSSANVYICVGVFYYVCMCPYLCVSASVCVCVRFHPQSIPVPDQHGTASSPIGDINYKFRREACCVSFLHTHYFALSCVFVVWLTCAVPDRGCNFGCDFVCVCLFVT